ncbi:acetoin utilization AcuB family protein [Sporosarcina sp. Marseille-Q4063]|uniref:acetoin utilization AcuB family protein n=1 Tax=Sporosarcina sp. Marseille-Q4063 TaxID=2810514 RepID=UPI001BAEEB68|nr:acetoin utilization AcuB family protein [Sporosarcina sp. Marseille-Q4063]QUW22736.1 acetoin utilization AcuB family protein [Sporosarcina sp. Marseille-Q4063]
MLIEEIMKQDVVTLFPSNTVRDALEIMLENKIRHLPIITEDRAVVGIITDRDLKGIVPSTMSDIRDKSVYDIKLSEVMTKNPITAHPMDFVEESAVVFYSNQIGSLPIVSNNKLVGIITETDLLYKYIELTGAHQPGSQIEVRVPNIPGILFEVSKVFYEQKTNVLSVLVYPDKENAANKILVIRIKTMNPLKVIDGLKTEGFEVLWPNVPGIS